MTNSNVITREVQIKNICDRGIVFAFCAIIYFLPISIALLDSFAGLAIFFYALKKISGIVFVWKSQISPLRFSDKIIFVLKSLGPIPNVLNRPIGILALVIFISALHSQYLTLSLFAFVGKFSKGIFLYFSFIEVFVTQKRIRLFLVVFLMSAFLVALSGIIEHYIGIDFIRGHHLTGGQISSSFSFANSLGDYLLFPLGIVSYLVYRLFLKQKLFLLRGILTVLFVMLIVCLGWTYCRGAWVGFIFLLLCMILRDKRKIFYGLALLTIFILLFESSLHHVRHVSLFKDNVSSLSEKNIMEFLQQGGSGRSIFWKNAIFITEHYPFWGSGLNTYARMLDRYSMSPWYAHNSYLQMAAEIGVIGLSCFLWLLFVLFRRGFMALNQIGDTGAKPVLEGTLAGMAGFLVASFFDTTLHEVQLGVLFWLMLGLLVSQMHLNLPPKESLTVFDKGR